LPVRYDGGLEVVGDHSGLEIRDAMKVGEIASVGDDDIISAASIRQKAPELRALV
jgi:hypothetical protein